MGNLAGKVYEKVTQAVPEEDGVIQGGRVTLTESESGEEVTAHFRTAPNNGQHTLKEMKEHSVSIDGELGTILTEKFQSYREFIDSETVEIIDILCLADERLVIRGRTSVELEDVPREKIRREMSDYASDVSADDIDSWVVELIVDRDREEDANGIETQTERGNDYTVFYQTESPQDVWSSPDTVEEYCQQQAERRDDVTVEELREQDTYICHYHINEFQDKAQIDYLIENIAYDASRDYVTVSGDGMEVYPTRIECFDDEVEVTVSILQHLSTPEE